jgi:hypothetical protein
MYDDECCYGGHEDFTIVGHCDCCGKDYGPAVIYHCGQAPPVRNCCGGTVEWRTVATA